MEKLNFSLVGDSGVGKSALINRWKSGQFQHIPTLAPKVTPFRFHTNYGWFEFDMYEGDNPDRVDGVIIMGDKTNPESWRRVKEYLEFYLAPPNRPAIVVCGNKTDLHPDIVHDNQIYKICRDHEIPYYDVSAKSNYNFEKPFLCLLRHISGHEDLRFKDLRGVRDN